METRFLLPPGCLTPQLQTFGGLFPESVPAQCVSTRLWLHRNFWAKTLPLALSLLLPEIRPQTSRMPATRISLIHASVRYQFTVRCLFGSPPSAGDSKKTVVKSKPSGLMA